MTDTPTPPDHSRLHKAIWVLIYGGLLSLSLSLFLPDQAPVLQGLFRWGGALAAGVGALLVVLRSRMPGE